MVQRPCRGAQASIGTALLGLLTLADVFVGGYVVILDECVKERRRVRTKPYQLDLDDALALTDDDALAKDMFARPSANGPQSYYMQARAHVPLALLPGACRCRCTACWCMQASPVCLCKLAASAGWCTCVSCPLHASIDCSGRSSSMRIPHSCE